MTHEFPSLDLLSPSVINAELEEKGRALMTCLADLSIQAELVRISPGPVVTSFEVRLAPGMKIARIVGMSDNITHNLKVASVRIYPILGADTVSVEIPNARRENIGLRELLETPAFQTAQKASLLNMPLGKDVFGHPVFADLAEMPHMLVAGATGAGKSVFLNTVLLSFLYRAQPEELKLLLIDPKRVEMAVYADLPHLVHPIVVEPVMAKNALDWAVKEMGHRYSALERLGVRNMQAYNQKVQKLLEPGAARSPEFADLTPMPSLVIIIDELADLMFTAGKDVETSIVRLGQLARAAGIHLIVATQRPSVNVVTGLIKANLPCRIAFQVVSQTDSRTILDAAGADRLLGKGDMLFKPDGEAMRRLHGAFVPDEEVGRVADFWRGQAKPDYQVDFAEWGEDDAEQQGADLGNGGAYAQGDISAEPSYQETVDFVRQQGKVSISLIQRRFSIGFNKAGRYVEQMEQDGIIGAANGNKPREIRYRGWAKDASDALDFLTHKNNSTLKVSVTIDRGRF
jgi:S-DNA-T family DNA segregation ATPase FtsK/SpoIIIE